MYLKDKKKSGFDKIYIWTFLISFLLSVYFSFDSFWYGELSKYLEVNLPNPAQRYITIIHISILATSLLFFHKKNRLKDLTHLGKTLFIFSLYILCSCLITKNYNRFIDYLELFLTASLWIYIYLFTYTLRLRYDIDKYIPKFIIIFYILSVVLFLRNYYFNNQIGNEWQYIESYYAITLLPAITLLKKKYVYIFFFITIACSIIACKRTGIITCVTSIVLYIIIAGKSLTYKIITILTGSVALLAMYIALNHFMAKDIEAIAERIVNIKEDDGSGRGEMYNSVFQEIASNTDINSFLFGKGHNEVINSKGSQGFSAHNEFLEVAYDYGVVGFIIFSFIFIAIFISYCKTKTHQHKVAMLISLFIFFAFSLTSHTILNTTNIVFLCMIWGYIDAKNKIGSKNIVSFNKTTNPQ